ncbi:MAG: hypothetical protein JWQ27_159 [Ferruginibacter sp.]|nr:hypothetical protein [Ferruginibacter sp.]
MKILRDNSFAGFLVRFGLIFIVCYYGSLAVIGLSAPGKHYSPFVAEHLNFIGWIRASLLWGTGKLLSLFGIATFKLDDYVLRKVNGRGIRMVYECIGYGVMSFWIAFVGASEGPFKKRFIWIIGGLLAIWTINVIRLSLVLTAVNNNWSFPLGLDHHTWFNIVAYLFIFGMIFLFNKKGNRLPEQN